MTFEQRHPIIVRHPDGSLNRFSNLATAKKARPWVQGSMHPYSACPDCQGSGEIPGGDFRIRCSPCKGTGVLSEERVNAALDGMIGHQRP